MDKSNASEQPNLNVPAESNRPTVLRTDIQSFSSEDGSPTKLESSTDPEEQVKHKPVVPVYKSAMERRKVHTAD